MTAAVSGPSRAYRDYQGEMDALIAEATAGSGWAVPVVAAKLHASLLESDPELLDGWLHEIAPSLLSKMIQLRECALRSMARRYAARREFEEAAGRAGESGDYSGLMSLFTVTHVIDEDSTRKRAADMTARDHLFVAEHEYQRTADRALMIASFHRAVAAEVGDRRTSDVFTAETYDELYRSITGGVT